MVSCSKNSCYFLGSGIPECPIGINPNLQKRQAAVCREFLTVLAAERLFLSRGGVVCRQPLNRAGQIFGRIGLVN